MSPIKCGFQITEAYSKCGRTNVIYIHKEYETYVDLSIQLKNHLMIPITLFALCAILLMY